MKRSTTIGALLQMAGSWRQSVLKRAFEGRLNEKGDNAFETGSIAGRHPLAGSPVQT
jgi:hypothetical protein